MELAVYNIKGEDTGKKVTLNDEVFALAEPNEHAVYLDVKQYLANQRQGTHKAKERSEVSGSTKKLGRQKGGGGARHGDINSPVVKRHGFGGVGQTTHGQHNRLRAPGSIGACSYPAKVFKGMRMAGHMGAERVTVQNLQIIKVMPENNVLVVKGSVPGAKGSILSIVK